MPLEPLLRRYDPFQPRIKRKREQLPKEGMPGKRSAMVTIQSMQLQFHCSHQQVSSSFPPLCSNKNSVCLSQTSPYSLHRSLIISIFFVYISTCPVVENNANEAMTSSRTPQWSYGATQKTILSVSCRRTKKEDAVTTSLVNIYN